MSKVKVSQYKMGQPRFGTKGGRPADWDRSVKEYKLTPEQLKKYLAGVPMEQILAEEGEETMGEPKVISYQKYKQLEEENEKLRFDLKNNKVTNNSPDPEEIATLKALAAKWEDRASSISADYDAAELEIEQLKKEMAASQSIFEEAMAAKEAALKESIQLNNQLNRVKDAFNETREMYEALRDQYNRLYQEVRPLRALAYAKLKDDVERDARQ
jgi:chromosome segregation ATPase